MTQPAPHDILKSVFGSIVKSDEIIDSAIQKVAASGNSAE